MNTTNPYPLRIWRWVKHRVDAWHGRPTLHIALGDCSDRDLQDIGLRRDDRMRPAKLFWMR
jgi:uncharacterized protein YjiS (DUF1127 family)